MKTNSTPNVNQWKFTNVQFKASQSGVLKQVRPSVQSHMPCFSFRVAKDSQCITRAAIPPKNSSSLKKNTVHITVPNINETSPCRQQEQQRNDFCQQQGNTDTPRDDIFEQMFKALYGSEYQEQVRRQRIGRVRTPRVRLSIPISELINQ